MIRMSEKPASLRCAPTSRPPKPPPATMTSVWSTIGAREKSASAHGSLAKSANFPSTVGTYCLFPSSRIRLSRSSSYFFLSCRGSNSSGPMRLSIVWCARPCLHLEDSPEAEIVIQDCGFGGGSLEDRCSLGLERRAMVSDRAVHDGQSERPGFDRDQQSDVRRGRAVDRADRFAVARLAECFRQVGHGLSAVSTLEHRRGVATHLRRPIGRSGL